MESHRRRTLFVYRPRKHKYNCGGIVDKCFSMAYYLYANWEACSAEAELSKAVITNRRLPQVLGDYKMAETYIDLEVLAEVVGEDSYLVVVSKEDLRQLVDFSSQLVLRSWDGKKPVVLEPYGDSAVRTSEDASETNNLVGLPNIKRRSISSILG